MALTSASKPSAMLFLNVRFMVKSEDAYIFPFHKMEIVGERVKHHQNYIFIST